MQKTYPPSEVRTWTVEQMRDLVGKFVVVECWSTDAEREFYDSSWVGGEGVVVGAGRRANGATDYPPADVEDGDVWWVMWDYGMGWQWTVDAMAYVSVCDGKTRNFDHGVPHDRSSAADRSCVAHLGVRGDTLEAAIAKYGE